jgi:hypothetical protein
VKVGWRALQLMRESVRQMRTDSEKPKTIGGGRDLRMAARLETRRPGNEAQVPRGGRRAGCVPDRPGRRLPPGCFPEAKLPGGGCFLSGRWTPLPN